MKARAEGYVRKEGDCWNFSHSEKGRKPETKSSCKRKWHELPKQKILRQGTKPEGSPFTHQNHNNEVPLPRAWDRAEDARAQMGR